MGRALLAGFSDTVVRARLESESAFARLTESSTRDATSLIGKLRKVREAGFATEVGEIRAGVIGLGVSLPRSDDSAPRLAVGVSVVGSTVTSVDAQLVGALVELATRLADERSHDATSGDVQRAEHPRSVA
jgi:DNA-binding IclR family transcriptional regulator